MASQPRPFTEREIRMARPLIRAMSRANVWIYKLSGGRLGGTWLRGAPVCLLTTVGRRSGEPRTTPLLYLEDDERVLLVASLGGMPMHPLWYRNLQAHPACEAQIGGEVRKMHARTATSEEKQAYWPRLTAMYPDYDDYQKRTDREIPVVICEPR